MLTHKRSLYTYRNLSSKDIPDMVTSFAELGWAGKSTQLFEQYLEEQHQGDRQCWVAYMGERFAGYVTLKWQSGYQPFAEARIPEIVDLNVLPAFRNCGVGSALLERCEQEAATRSSVVGIGVGLYTDYGAAQRLYVKRGYVPDGRGVHYDGAPVVAREAYPVDDSLVLCFTKALR